MRTSICVRVKKQKEQHIACKFFCCSPIILDNSYLHIS
ncbi:hypothetical protein T4B_5828 [Trichinella pseudospiralis]|uniref:Uncharacterized protein n=1 Tax=Trichinella pseudospiralis TaxID=6337 RepID=A0A0V1GJY3_TRIPS|nr:hypothetical protein T4B_5828 [Trichinella pseudospiralis]